MSEHPSTDLTANSVPKDLTPSLKRAIYKKIEDLNSFGFGALIAEYGVSNMIKLLVEFASDRGKLIAFEGQYKEFPNTGNNFKVNVFYRLFKKEQFEVASSFPCRERCHCHQDNTGEKYPHANSSKSCLACAILRYKVIEFQSTKYA